jgi:hypothetical protein
MVIVTRKIDQNMAINQILNKNLQPTFYIYGYTLTIQTVQNHFIFLLIIIIWFAIRWNFANRKMLHGTHQIWTNPYNTPFETMETWQTQKRDNKKEGNGT